MNTSKHPVLISPATTVQNLERLNNEYVDQPIAEVKHDDDDDDKSSQNRSCEKYARGGGANKIGPFSAKNICSSTFDIFWVYLQGMEGTVKRKRFIPLTQLHAYLGTFFVAK